MSRHRKSSSAHRRSRHPGARQSPVRHGAVESQCLTLEITDLNSEGQGVARRDRDVYFVPGALPGERVDVVLDGRRKKVWQTRLRQVLSPSQQRLEPRCQHYRQCGGCDLQHMTYEAQLAAKQNRVERELRRQGITVESWQPAIVADAWHYRRKARLGVRYSRTDQQLYIGFREASSSHIANIDDCPVLIEHPALHWPRWRELLSELHHPDRISQIEVIQADNALALVLRVLKPLPEKDQQALIDFMNKLDTAAGESSALPVQLWLKYNEGEQCVYPSPAPATLWHNVGELTLNMQLNDFIQVNSKVNQAMVAQALSWLDLAADDKVCDLFAGHGNFSMALAQCSQQVTALEVQQDMVNSLRQQAEHLALPLMAQQADLSLPDCLAATPKVDAVLLDPPRAGAAAVVQALIQRQVKKILYVSCDVATLARDLAQLCDAGYRVEKAGMMDMFPQTHHVETMVLLQYESKEHG